MIYILKYSTILIYLFIGLYTHAQQKSYSLTKKWETEALLKVPESVIFDELNNVLYVSNINGKPDDIDGNGFISKLLLTGKIENLEWVKGLNAPKGMGIYEGKLYVTDINKLVIIDIKSGQILKNIEVGGAKFLNDVTIDKSGNVYFSDSYDKKIYLLINDKPSVWKASDTWGAPNGLLALEKNLHMVDMKTGNFIVFDLDKKETIIADSLQGADGVESVGNNEFLISNWNGEVYYVNTRGVVTELIDTKRTKTKRSRYRIHSI